MHQSAIRETQPRKHRGGRRRTGTVAWHNSPDGAHWDAMIMLDGLDGKPHRKRICLPSRMSKEMAREKAAFYSQNVEIIPPDEAPPARTASVIRLPRPAPDGTVIEILESLLERARRGEVNGIAIAAHVNANDTATVYRVGQHGDVAHLVCAIERVKLRLLKHLYE